MPVRRAFLVLLALGLSLVAFSMLQPWHRFETSIPSPLAFYQGPDVHMNAAERASLTTRSFGEHDGFFHHSSALFSLACACALAALLAVRSRRAWLSALPALGTIAGTLVAALPVFCLERRSQTYVAESLFRYAWYASAALACALFGLLVLGYVRESRCAS